MPTWTNMSLAAATWPLVGGTRMIFGYLDAGSGSLILQAVLGGIAGVVVAAKAWKARMLGRRAVAEATDTDAVADDTALTSES